MFDLANYFAIQFRCFEWTTVHPKNLNFNRSASITESIRTLNSITVCIKEELVAEN